MSAIKTRPLTTAVFAPYSDVLEAVGAADIIINRGRCSRFHNLATLDFTDGQAGISIFKSETYKLPFKLELVERHPEGSQAFVPMCHNPFLVVVADDQDGTPVSPQAFISTPGQAINFHRGIWHGVLTPLDEPGLFAVVDRIGAGANLEEYIFDSPWLIEQS